MATIGENIRRLRLVNRMCQIELARLSGLHQGQISNYERGRDEPKRDNLKAIANALHCRMDELDEGLAGIPALEDLDEVAMRRVPVYGLAMAKGITDWHGDVIPEGEYELDTTEAPADGRRYAAFKVEGDSMEPRIHDGDIVFADIDLEPQPGNIVVAKWDDTVMIKRYRRYGSQIVLESINPRYEPIQVRPIWMLRVRRIVSEV